MLTAQLYAPDGCGVGYLGDLGAYSVADLQKLLYDLSKQYNDTKLAPGEYQGTATDRTLTATINALIKTGKSVPYLKTVMGVLDSIINVVGKIPKVGPTIQTALRTPGQLSWALQQAANAATVLKTFGVPDVSVYIHDVQNAISAAAGWVAGNATTVYVVLMGASAVGAMVTAGQGPPTSGGEAGPPITVPSQQQQQAVVGVMTVTRPTTAAPPGPAPTGRVYPPGTITAFSPKLGKWRIAIPRGAFAGLGIADTNGYCIFGDCGLGQTHTEDAPSDTLPTGPRQVAEDALDTAVGTKQPIYKKVWFWVGIGGGVAALGGGAYYLTRKKKAA
jgi:hypothetical protein